MIARAYDPWGGHPIATNDNRPQTTMVERVARALAFVDGHGDFLPGGEAKGWHEPARAAIEAMRWPTMAQLAAAQTAWLNDPQRRSSTIYRAMIDAALEEAA